MKKILLMATAVAAMASCAKTEVSEINSQSPEVIKFTTPYVSSKAADVTTDIINADGTKVAIFANVTGEAKFAGFIDDVLTHNGKAFLPAGTYTWPGSGTLDFFAYYPMVENQAQTDGLVPVTIATTAATQTDVLAASTLGASKGTTGAVNIALKHMLSKVDFKFTIAENIEFNIKSFKLFGVNGETTGLNLKAEGGPAMSAATTSSSYTYGESADFTTEKEVASTDDSTDITISSLTTDAGSFMLLPQTLVAPTVTNKVLSTTTGAYIQIEYTMSFDGGKTYVVGDNKTAYATANIPMPAQTLEAGKSYVFALSVNKDAFNGGYKAAEGDDQGKEFINEASKISFVVTVGDWTPANDNNGNVSM